MGSTTIFSNQTGGLASVFEHLTDEQIEDVVSNTASINISTEINNAFSANKAVFFPPGTYLADGLTPQRDQTIMGSGRLSIIKSANTSGGDCMTTATVPATSGTDGFFMSNIRLQGAGKSAGGGSGLHLDDCTRWQLWNVEIDVHGGDGLKLTGNTFIGMAIGCTFGNNGGDGVDSNMESATVSSNFSQEFISCAVSGNGANGYHINDSAIVDGNVFNIYGGSVEQNNIGIRAERTSALSIDGVYFEGNTTRKIELVGMTRLSSCMMRNIRGGGGAPIYLDSGQFSLDGITFFEEGNVVDISTDGNYEVKNFILNPSVPTDPCYILERQRRNRGVQGLGNYLRNGNFVPWNVQQTEPSYWSTLGTPTFAKDTPPDRCSGQALKITAGADSSGVQYTITDLAEDDVITLSAWAKATAGDTAILRIADSGGQAVLLEITPTDWRRYTIQHQISSGTTCTIQAYAKTNTDIVWFSEIQANQASDLRGFLLNERDVIENIYQDPSDNDLIQDLDDTGTPSVQFGKTFKTNGTTTVTDFDDGIPGQRITILFDHSKTITHGTNIFLKAGSSLNAVAGDTLELINRADTFWYEV